MEYFTWCVFVFFLNIKIDYLRHNYSIIRFLQALLRCQKKTVRLGWRDGSVVKSTNYSSRGPEFNSQQPHVGSQPSVMRSDTLFWCVWRQLQCTHIHKQINLKKKKDLYKKQAAVYDCPGEREAPSCKLPFTRSHTRYPVSSPCHS